MKFQIKKSHVKGKKTQTIKKQKEYILSVVDYVDKTTKKEGVKISVLRLIDQVVVLEIKTNKIEKILDIINREVKYYGKSITEIRRKDKFNK